MGVDPLDKERQRGSTFKLRCWRGAITATKMTSLLIPQPLKKGEMGETHISTIVVRRLEWFHIPAVINAHYILKESK
jgi:hypothetical protein